MSLAAAVALGSASSSVPRSRRTSSLQVLMASTLGATSSGLRTFSCSTRRERRRRSRSCAAGSFSGRSVSLGSLPGLLGDVPGAALWPALSHSQTGATWAGVTNSGPWSSPRSAACTAASKGAVSARRLDSLGRCARCACTRLAWRLRRPAKRCSARAVAARLSATQSPLGSNTAASAASHRYRSRLSSRASNTDSSAGRASVSQSSTGMGARRLLPAMRCSQPRGPPWRLSATGATRTAALPPPALYSKAMLRRMDSSVTWCSVRSGSATRVMARCHLAPTHSSIRTAPRAAGAWFRAPRPGPLSIPVLPCGPGWSGCCRRRPGTGRTARRQTSCV